MNLSIVIMVIAGGVLVMGGILFNYHLYQLVKFDASARKMKRPGLWALFSLSNGDGSGILPIYLMTRRKYPRRPLTAQEESDYQIRKKKANLALMMILAGAIPLVVTAIFYWGSM